ncbi:aminoglycoside phosphotransferase [Lysinibacillus fusiformis]|nr:aminoglycoside phosphotransferase [Lysinibacillus fusiformis]
MDIEGGIEMNLLVGNRARGWALWKALITYDYHKLSNKAIADEQWNIINVIMVDHLKSLLFINR